MWFAFTGKESLDSFGRRKCLNKEVNSKSKITFEYEKPKMPTSFNYKTTSVDYKEL